MPSRGSRMLRVVFNTWGSSNAVLQKQLGAKLNLTYAYIYIYIYILFVYIYIYFCFMCLFVQVYRQCNATGAQEALNALSPRSLAAFGYNGEP